MVIVIGNLSDWNIQTTQMLLPTFILLPFLYFIYDQVSTNFVLPVMIYLKPSTQFIVLLYGVLNTFERESSFLFPNETFFLFFKDIYLL